MGFSAPGIVKLSLNRLDEFMNGLGYSSTTCSNKMSVSSKEGRKIGYVGK